MISKNIKEARLKNGMTQAELGELVGQPREVICRWESGNHTPTIHSLSKIADALNVSILDLMK